MSREQLKQHCDLMILQQVPSVIRETNRKFQHILNSDVVI